MKDKTQERANILQNIRSAVSRGVGINGACADAGVSPAWFQRWNGRYLESGLYGLSDQPRPGRPRNVEPTEEDAKVLRRNFLKSNLNKKAGSMTLAARYAAKTGQLSEALAAEILKPRASKHLLPTAVRLCCRASGAEVARYRDPKAGQNDGLFVPGWLRMTEDGSRRICPNERWVGDDASVNVGVVVPWTRGGDRCSEAFGCRVARFQLLMLIDCATDMIMGYNYVMRANDAYTASDVVSTLHKVAVLRGGMPAQMVMEGGSWQAERTVSYLKACGTQLISAKGRPNQKLIEGLFNRLWSVMSLTLPPYGQIGRFRGEMGKEKDLWMRCRKGSEDPRRHFPSLTEFLKAVDDAIDYCNTEQCESPDYGIWVPFESYGALSGQFPKMALNPIPQGLRRYAMPVRVERVLRRAGMAFCRHLDPFGYPHEYAFAVREGAFYDGARVIVSFDPMEIRQGASVELADNWRDLRAGRVLDEAALCVSPAPVLDRTRNFYHIGTLDPRKSAAEVKRKGRALVGERVAAFDERGVVARSAEEILMTEDGGQRTARQYAFGAKEPVAVQAEPDYDNAVDFDALYKAAGIA